MADEKPRVNRRSLSRRSLYEGLTESQHGTHGQKSVVFTSFSSFLIVALLVLTWVLMSEMLQDNEWITTHTLAVRATVVGAYSVGLIPAQILEKCLGQRRPPEERRRKSFLRRAFWWMLPTALCTMYLNGYFWYLSLKGTTAALNASLYQSQCVFVYFLSILFLREPVVGRKILAMLVSLTGVALISFGGAGHGNENQENTVIGIMFTLVSAILFAIYEVETKFIEHRFYDKKFKIRDSLYWLGYNGVIVLVVAPGFLAICHYTGVETFTVPDRTAVLLLLELVSFDLVFNALLVIGIAVSNPYLISLGMLLVIPASFFADYALGKLTQAPNLMQVGGTILVGCGFIILKVRLCGACTKRDSGDDNQKLHFFNTPLLGDVSRFDGMNPDGSSPQILATSDGTVSPI